MVTLRVDIPRHRVTRHVVAHFLHDSVRNVVQEHLPNLPKAVLPVGRGALNVLFNCRESHRDIIVKKAEWWAVRDSNPRPSGCKPDALNQLS